MQRDRQKETKRWKGRRERQRQAENMRDGRRQRERKKCERGCHSECTLSYKIYIY